MVNWARLSCGFQNKRRPIAVPLSERVWGVHGARAVAVFSFIDVCPVCPVRYLYFLFESSVVGLGALVEGQAVLNWARLSCGFQNKRRHIAVPAV